jgi:hypothetical protein
MQVTRRGIATPRVLDFRTTLTASSFERLRAARESIVWGVELDEDDVPTIVRYSVRRSR